MRTPYRLLSTVLSATLLLLVTQTATISRSAEEPLFDSVLTKWSIVCLNTPKTRPSEQSVFQIKDGIVSSRNGKVKGRVPKGAMLVTNASYENYRLKGEFRWSTTGSEKCDSGIFIHSTGRLPFSQNPIVELQLARNTPQNFGSGDIVLLGKNPVSSLVFNGNLEKSYSQLPRDGFPKSYENETGEWNSFEIVSQEGSIKYFINGALAATGAKSSPSSGKILLQAGTMNIDFRNFKIEVLGD